MLLLLKIKGIGASKHKSNGFAFAAFYTSCFAQKSLEVYMYIEYEHHLIKDLKANMLIGNNFFYIKGFSINLANASAHIFKCGVNIEITASSHSQFLRCNILANAIIFISTKPEVFILFWYILLPNSFDILF